jgi:peptidoglycan-associated lipoprotein
MDPSFMVTIEGHCDERGSAEYNIGLGDRRSAAVRDALVSMGIPGDKLKTVSYGKERPICTDANESCYARNRRAHFSAGQ